MPYTLITIIAQIRITNEQIPYLPTAELGGDDLRLALRVMFALAGAIALVVITLGGLKYALSQGDPQQAASGKNAILYGLIGLVVVIMAVTIVNFVVVRLI